jgi:addiction module RelE/StbE family toxin
MNKKYRITIEKYAQKDIESIYNYICDNLVNKEAAIKLLNKINEKFDSIALFPKSASLLNNDYVTNKNIRKLLIDNYIAFYEVDDINKEIKIIRIIYGMQNYIDVL